MTVMKWRHALLAAAFAVLPFGIGAAQAAGTLTVALSSDDGTWDPIDTWSGVVFFVVENQADVRAETARRSDPGVPPYDAGSAS